VPCITDILANERNNRDGGKWQNVSPGVVLRLELTMIFHLLIAALLLAACVFWVFMIIECATKEPASGNGKLIWILIIIFTHSIGALIYYFVRRPQRIADLGA
jgi:hypothetical protein